MKEETNFEYNLVDLGLPSGTLWMDRNIGASSPYDVGLYFAWGETEGYTADEVGSKKQFSWADYKYANGGSHKLTKYCKNKEYGDDGYIDSFTTLETTDDAAIKYTNGDCSIPTKNHLQELLDNTKKKWTIKNNVHGMLLTSKNNGNSIFLPAPEKIINGLKSGDYVSVLWSSSLNTSIPPSASALIFFYCCMSTLHPFEVDISKNFERCYNRNIRGIKIK